MAAYKGAISFGLVYIPVTLNVSVKENDIGFNMIDKKTKTRIKYKKTCIDCDNREVKNEDIVKGYQYEKDKYVIFTDEDFEKIKTPKDKTITISQFVDLREVDPVYYDKSYYVSPTGGEKAFNVLLSAMEKQNKAALAKTVIGTKETLILMRASKGNMLASTLYFHDEIQAAPAVKKTKLEAKEVSLAVSLINQMSAPFTPEKYKDEYNERVKKAIKRKIAGNQIIQHKERQAPANVINLMDALQKSLNSQPEKKGRKKHGT